MQATSVGRALLILAVILAFLFLVPSAAKMLFGSVLGFAT